MDFPHVLTVAIFICAPSVRPAKKGTSFRCLTNCLISLDIDFLIDVTYAELVSIDSKLNEGISGAIYATMTFVSSV